MNLLPVAREGRAPLRVKCLLVDDLDENLLALSALLHAGDVDLLKARSGAEALELLLVHDVALAFVDVQMPDMDGFELAEIMRGSERTRNVPIIFVTAGNRDQHRMFKGYESGAVDFLYKPIEPHILRNKADVFFQLYRQKQQLALELRERTETLRLNEMFIAVLGHDLRNPLNAILMSAELLQRYPNAEAIDKTVSRVLSSGLRMSRMIDDMLDLARLRLGTGLTLQTDEIDLGALVGRVVQEHEAAHPQRRIEIVGQGDLNGCWDSDRLAQVASNLVGNALQHGDDGSIVQLQLDGTEADSVALGVINDGRIPAEALPYLFNPFRSGERHSGRSNGLGLGLYIAQQIVQAHGGHIEAQIPEDGKIRFQVTVPRRRADGER